MVIFGGDVKDVKNLITDPNLNWAIGTMLPSFDIRFVWYNMIGYWTLRRWCGTDVLKCRLYWHYRLRAKLCNFFIDKHCFVSESLKQEFIKIFPKAETMAKLWPAIPDEYERRFNVLVYLPKAKRTKKLRDYIYGKKIYDVLSRKYTDWNWLILHGDIPKNIVMELYFQADVLFRSNHHNGCPRMVLEARSIGLPVVWNPERMTVPYAERKLMEIYKKWKQNRQAMI